jgi:hypothetical protein
MHLLRDITDAGDAESKALLDPRSRGSGEFIVSRLVDFAPDAPRHGEDPIDERRRRLDASRAAQLEVRVCIGQAVDGNCVTQIDDFGVGILAIQIFE